MGFDRAAQHEPMRTVKFKSVFDRVVRLWGRDPIAEIPQDMARAALDHINERVESVYGAWNWPEWELTEERAFRQIWTPTDQYKRVSDADGLPEEVYYLTNQLYYRVLATAPTDPPVGTVPTDVTYWEQMTAPIDTFIDYDQRCRRALGRVIGVYSSNPRANGCCSSARGLSFHPSEKGIDVCCAGGLTTVFVKHMMPMPTYTIVPYVVGKSYVRADIVFDRTTNECFQTVDTTTDSPTVGSTWRWIPFLDKWATFVVQGAFSDCLTEFDQGGNDDLQAKMALAANAENRAQEALQNQIDQLRAQGQKLQWNFCKRHHYWCETSPWSGGTVSTLTAVCQDELGFVYPTPVPPVPPAAQRLLYFPDVNSLKTITPTLVATVATATLSVGTMAIIRTGFHFRLDAGPADDTDPGQGIPFDYNAGTNNVHWTEVI